MISGTKISISKMDFGIQELSWLRGRGGHRGRGESPLAASEQKQVKICSVYLRKFSIHVNIFLLRFEQSFLQIKIFLYVNIYLFFLRFGCSFLHIKMLFFVNFYFFLIRFECSSIIPNNFISTFVPSSLQKILFLCQHILILYKQNKKLF